MIKKEMYKQGQNNMTVLDIKGDYALICKMKCNKSIVHEYVIAYGCEVDKNNNIEWCSGKYYFEFDNAIQNWLNI